jgi:hypothetical protein
MTAAKAVEIDPQFFENRGENAWKLDTDNRRLHSRFGFAEVRVQRGKEGGPDFDRVVYGEAPNINAVVYGIDGNGVYYVGVVVQQRPFADNPNGSPAEVPIVFGQPCVMGFLDKIVGDKLAKAFESPEDGAVREALEEAGVAAVEEIAEMGHHNPNPTFCATWSNLIEIKVNLDKIREPVDAKELIYRAEYLPVREVMRRIGEGEYENVNYRSATANDAFFVWLARHPEALLSA